VPKKVLKGKIEGRGPGGRTRGRWIDAMGRDAKRILKCRNCRRSAEDRVAWRRRIKVVKAQVGL
jgi:hypothetical protein